MLDINAYPDSNITFVFTDIQGSSRTTSELEKVRIGTYEEKLRDPHRQRLLDLVKTYNGHEIHRAGDGHLFVFKFVKDALDCVVSFQQSLHANPITHTEGGKTYDVNVRIGVHTAVDQRKPTKMENGLPEYPGTDTNYAARVGGLGIGGQIIVSQSAYRHARKLIDYETPPCAVQPWPGRFLKSFPGSQLVYELLYFDGQSPFEPGMRWFAEWYRSERNRFVDRPAKEAEVMAGFDAKKTRIVTITGIGGTGKTRLAIACAAKRAGLYDDGVYFVSLATADLVETPEAVAASRNVEFVAQAIGAALNVQGEAAQPERLFQMLRTKNVLLVLDNYESAHCDDVSHYLIKLTTETPGVSLLVTGRERVDVDDMEALVSLNDGMASDEARLLFLDRARLKRKMPAPLSPNDEMQLNRILELTECIPLALELAAARIESYSLKQIADRIEATPLGDGGTAKGHRADDEISFRRHRSLERSLTWSYNLLTAEAQMVLATSGLFADTFDAAMLGTVQGNDETENGLQDLLDASLVYEDIKQQSADAYRFRLHRATRAYAVSKLAALPDADAVRQRFVDYYCEFVDANRNLNDATHRALLTMEWQNVLAAVRTAESTRDWSSVLTLANLGLFLNLRGVWLEQESLYDTALASSKRMMDRRGKAHMLNNLGVVYQSKGQWDKAEKLHNESLRIFQEKGDREGEGATLNNIGVVHQKRGQLREAEQIYKQCLQVCEEAGDRIGVGKALTGLANVYVLQEQGHKAEAAYETSLAHFRELGDRQGEGLALVGLGTACLVQEHWDRAEMINEMGLLILQELGDQRGMGQSLGNRGVIHQRRGDWEESGSAYENSLAIFRELNDLDGVAHTLNNLGMIYQNLTKWCQAEKAYEDSLKIRQELGDTRGVGLTLTSIVRLKMVQEKQSEAIPYAREAVAALERTEDIAELAKARDLLNWLLLE